MSNDPFLNLISLRATREFKSEPIPDDVVKRILEAGRTAGSSKNTQPWTFYVARTRDMLDKIAPFVRAPENVERCSLAVTIATSRPGFDTGRCAERMMLAAWAEGVGSVPNGIRDQDDLAALLNLPEGGSVGTVLTFGYPKTRQNQRPAEDILRRIARKPLSEIVVWL